jgi:hypothetical protein
MSEKPNIDTHSQTWISLKRYLNDRLQTLRMQNDAPKTFDETERLRGQIAEIKVMLSLGKEHGE